MNQATPLSDDEVSELEQLLDRLPAPLEPLDISALDGFLCGVLLQPQPVPAAQWLRWVGDVEGQALPPGPQAERLATLGTVEDTVEIARTTGAGTVVLSAADLGPARTAEPVPGDGRVGVGRAAYAGE